MNAFDFLTPARIVFGWGRHAEVGSLAKTLGSRAFVICGSRTLAASGSLEEILNALRAQGLETVSLTAPTGEPTVAGVDRLVGQLRESVPRQGDLVIGVGGGSTLDFAKAAAALAVQRETASVADYLEGIGRGLAVSTPPLPMLAMPTTGGTGTEATKNAVITSLNPPAKKSLRSDLMVPRIVLVDPELSVSVPPEVTAWTGLDAITQLIESYVSRRSAPLPRALVPQALAGAIKWLPVAVSDGANREARSALSYAALLSGLALANSGLGLAHGVAAALGAFAGTPHGLACAVMLPVALRFNRQISEAPLAELAGAVTGRQFSRPSAAVDLLLQVIDGLLLDLNIPKGLSPLGIPESLLDDLVRGSRGNSLSGNPRDVHDDELRECLKNQW